MLKSAVILATTLACADAFAPGAMLTTTGRNTVAFGPMMQKQGSTGGQSVGSLGDIGARLGSLVPGGLGSMFNKGSQAPAPTAVGTGTQRPGTPRQGSQLVTPKAAAPKKAAPAPKKAAAPAARAPVKAAPVRTTGTTSNLSPSERVFSDEDLPARWVLPEGFGSPYDRNPPYSEWMPSPLWAREAEIKHGRVAMTAVLGLVVQELAPRGVPFEWYSGEKVLALHDKLVEVGAAWQLLLFIGLFELWWLRRYSTFELNGSGDYGFLKTYFDPLGLAKDDETFAINRVKETKNGRLAMISFAGIVHHYLITGKGPIEFITAPPLANCVAKASELPGASIAATFAPGGALDALCGF